MTTTATAGGAYCLIALGSNLGDRLTNLRDAVTELDGVNGVDVTAVSALYETAPVGGPGGQGPFLNAALAATSTIAPADLLAEMHRIEARHDRRRAVHWGPRTLDLDLLVFGATISDEPEVLLPHPRMHERRFVLVPVCDLAPGLVHPRLGLTMLELLDRLPIEPGDLSAIAADWRRSDDDERAVR